MSRSQATYYGEEIEVIFSCNWEYCDYGVPGSPSWYEPVGIRVEEVYVLGYKVEYTSFPRDLQEEIYNLSDEVEFERE